MAVRGVTLKWEGTFGLSLFAGLFGGGFTGEGDCIRTGGGRRHNGESDGQGVETVVTRWPGGIRTPADNRPRVKIRGIRQ